MEFVIITGLSGAGKSKAVSFMEDLDYFCVDNLPVPLIPKFAELGMASSGEYDRVALVTDIRAGTNFDGLFQALDVLKDMKCPCRILFMEAVDSVIIRRFKESRRSHPLAEEADSLEAAIGLERRMLAPLRERADQVIGTSNLSTSRLKDMLRQMFGRTGMSKEQMEVRVSSFGFKYGVPMEADLLFDVRFLPNPYYVTELRALTGLDSRVRDYAFQGGQGEEFFKRLWELVSWLLPRYEEEGKTSLVVCIGCTGGHHRSVAIAHALAEAIRAQGWPVTESHRDLARN